MIEVQRLLRTNMGRARIHLIIEFINNRFGTGDSLTLLMAKTAIMLRLYSVF